MLSEYASLDANLQALMKQASNANAELTRRIESDERNVSYGHWVHNICGNADFI